MAYLAPRSIQYMDEPVADWQKGLDAAQSKADLLTMAEQYARLFPDAAAAIAKMDSDDFGVFRAGLNKERRGKFSGEPWMDQFGCIIMPENAIRVGMIASRFHVPWGLAFRRMVEQKAITIDRNDNIIFADTATASNKSTEA